MISLNTRNLAPAFAVGAVAKCFAVLLLTGCLPVNADETKRVDVGLFSGGQIEGWQEERFAGVTRYDLVELDGTRVLMAISEDSASGLYREQRIDLQRTPWLNWSWRTENRLDTRNEQVKSGDDYAGRIYVVIMGDVLFWRTRALNYVWANATEQYATWPNAFAGNNAMMMAVRSCGDALATWYVEKRNVLEDLKAMFGEDIRYIDAVALMSDTDNTHGKVTAYYGDIFFSSE